MDSDDRKSYVNDIMFDFSFEKFLDTLTLLAENTEDLDRLKAAKLIYFADRLHLLRHGAPIIGDSYIHLEHGPVPSLSLDYIRDLIDPERNIVPNEKLEELKGRFTVSPNYRYETIGPKGDIEVNNLSESEIEVLNEITREYGDMSGWDLRNLSHTHSTWIDTVDNQRISYRLFFKDAGEEAVDGAYEFMVATQEDRDFTEYLNG
jgi:uncharacterized phage-associated protein